jgi:hypothetical protein
MLAAVANISQMRAATLTPPVDPSDREKVTETFLARSGFPDDVANRLEHYLVAMRARIETENPCAFKHVARTRQRTRDLFHEPKR